MPKLEYVVDSLDTVEEAHKALYKEEDGKFNLDLDAYAEREKKAVAAKNADLVTRLKKAQANADKFKDLDDAKLAAYQEWLATQQGDDDDDDEPPDTKKKEKVGDSKEQGGDLAALQAKWEKRAERQLAKVKDDLAQKLAEKDKQLAEVEQKRLAFKKETLLDQVGIRAGVLPERLDSWKKTFRDRFQFGEEEELIALDDEGDPSDVKPEKFATEVLFEKAGWFYRAPESGGSGSSNGGGNGKNFTGKKKSQYDRKAKLDFISKHGYEAWAKLAD